MNYCHVYSRERERAFYQAGEGERGGEKTESPRSKRGSSLMIRTEDNSKIGMWMDGWNVRKLWVFEGRLT